MYIIKCIAKIYICFVCFAISETAGISVLVWSSATQRFVSNTTINATRPIRLEPLPGMLGESHDSHMTSHDNHMTVT